MSWLTPFFLIEQVAKMEVHTYYYENFALQEMLKLDDGERPFTYVLNREHEDLTSLAISYAMGTIMLEWKHMINPTLKEIACLSANDWAEHTVGHSLTVPPYVYRRLYVKANLLDLLTRAHCDEISFNNHLDYIRKYPVLDATNSFFFKSFDDFVNKVLDCFNPIMGFDFDNYRELHHENKISAMSIKLETDAIGDTLAEIIGPNFYNILNKMHVINPKLVKMHDMLKIAVKQKPDKVIE